MDAARRANRFGWDGSGGPMTCSDATTPEDVTMLEPIAVPDPLAAVVGRRRPIRDRLRERLVAAAVAEGADRHAAEAAVDDLAGERPLLDWLMNGGFQKLLELILTLIKLAA